MSLPSLETFLFTVIYLNVALLNLYIIHKGNEQMITF